MRNTTIVVLLALAAPSASAEVTDSAMNGFTTANEVIIAESRAETWVAAVGQIGRWWSSDHTISGDASRLSIRPEMQGCFCETLGNTAGVVHLVVTMVNPTHLLRMTGGLGPLGLMGVDGNMTWDFDETEQGTRIRFKYAVGGYLDGGLDQLAGPVDSVLREALGRLKLYIETGSPEEPADLE